jgi:hypothetical protein
MSLPAGCLPQHAQLLFLMYRPVRQGGVMSDTIEEKPVNPKAESGRSESLRNNAAECP